jgi:hypothetical protein
MSLGEFRGYVSQSAVEKPVEEVPPPPPIQLSELFGLPEPVVEAGVGYQAKVIRRG